MSELSPQAQAFLDKVRATPVTTPAHRARVQSALQARLIMLPPPASAPPPALLPALHAALPAVKKLILAAALLGTGGASVAVYMDSHYELTSKKAIPTVMANPSSRVAPQRTDQAGSEPTAAATPTPFTNSAESTFTPLQSIEPVLLGAQQPSSELPSVDSTATGIMGIAPTAFDKEEGKKTHRKGVAASSAEQAPSLSATEQPAAKLLRGSSQTPQTTPESSVAVAASKNDSLRSGGPWAAAFGRTSLAQETGILREAQTALQSGDAKRSLEQLEQHQVLYPNGVLREERMAARILALCAMGRVQEARGEAEQLLRIAPRTPYANGIRASCISKIQ